MMLAMDVHNDCDWDDAVQYAFVEFDEGLITFLEGASRAFTDAREQAKDRGATLSEMSYMFGIEWGNPSDWGLREDSVVLAGNEQSALVEKVPEFEGERMELEECVVTTYGFHFTAVYKHTSARVTTARVNWGDFVTFQTKREIPQPCT